MTTVSAICDVQFPGWAGDKLAREVRRPGLAARLAPVVWPGAAAALALAFVLPNVLRVRDWAVMTDELLYTKLATAIAATGSPVPTIHGEYYGALAQLYPLLLSPLYALLDAPTAFRAAHVLNAVLFSSTAVPAYLLARAVVPAAAAAAVAVASVVCPWALVAAFVMTESVAYPAFAWAAVAIHGAVVAPSPRRDVVALLAIVVAFFARTQFVALAVVLPLAVLVHAAAAGPARAARVRGAVAAHRVLAYAYGGAALAVLALAAAGRLDAILGTYAVTATEGSILPGGVWGSAGAHLVAVGIGLGVLPVVLAAAWALGPGLRAADAAVRALAAVAVVTVPLFALQVASYDLRFGGTDLVRDRYLFYVVPLLLACAAAALLDRPPHVLAVAGAGLAFVVAVTAYEFPVVSPFSVDSPVALLNELVRDTSGGASAAAFVGAVAVLLVVAVLAARSLVSQRTVAAAVLGGMVAFGATAGGYVFVQALGSDGPSGRPLTSGMEGRADWVDGAAPDGEEVAMIAFAIDRGWAENAVRWWDVELWNAKIVNAGVDSSRAFSYTPFPVQEVTVDWGSGRFRTAIGTRFFVVATEDSRFRLAGPRRAARNGLELIAAERPYRAEWATRGVDADGWVRPGASATVRVFSRPGAGDELAALDVVLAAPPSDPAAYTLEPGGRAATVAAGSSTLERVEVCVPGGGRVDLSLGTARAARVPDVALAPGARGFRYVGVRIAGIALARGGACTAG